MINSEKNSGREDEVGESKSQKITGKPFKPVKKTPSSAITLAQGVHNEYVSNRASNSEIDPKLKHQMRMLLEAHILQNETDMHLEANHNIIRLAGLEIPPVIVYSQEEKDRVKLIYAIYEAGDFSDVTILKRLEGLLKKEQNESIVFLIEKIISKFFETDTNRTKKAAFSTDTETSELFSELYVQHSKLNWN